MIATWEIIVSIILAIIGLGVVCFIRNYEVYQSDALTVIPFLVIGAICFIALSSFLVGMTLFTVSFAMIAGILTLDKTHKWWINYGCYLVELAVGTLLALKGLNVL